MFEKKEHINTCNITIATHVIPLISSSETIGTYSFSSAVYTSLFYIKKADIDINVICSESRPNNEGILLAKSLGKQNIKTTLVTDATLFSLSNTIDKLLLGADSVSLHGVINKIGSSPFIQQTQIHDVPRYILCSEDTILPFDYILPKEQSKPQHEIISEKLKHVSIINPYFDITSLEFLTGIITEKGIYSPQQIKSLIKKRKIHPLLTAKQ